MATVNTPNLKASQEASAEIEKKAVVEIDKLKRKNTNIYLAASGASLLGGVGGIIYGISAKKSGWAKVGFFVLGSIIVGVPSGIISRSMIAKNEAAIDYLKTPSRATLATTEEQKENAHFEKGGGFN